MTDIPVSEIAFSRLDRTFDRPGFACGIAQLDDFLANHALRNQKQNMSQTWTMHEVGSTTILGYYSLCAAGVHATDLPQDQIKKLPSYPIPCILLAKFAITDNSQRKGMGKRLLKDALLRIADVSHQIGCFAVVVDAINDTARDFYEHFDFMRLPHKQSTLLLPIHRILRP